MTDTANFGISTARIIAVPPAWLKAVIDSAGSFAHRHRHEP